MGLNLERLHEMFDAQPDTKVLRYPGHCHDCGEAVQVDIRATGDGFAIEGGALYEPEPAQYFLKCDACFGKNPRLTDYQRCEVYSRVVGYLRPVTQWNDGKQAEFADRQLFNHDF